MWPHVALGDDFLALRSTEPVLFVDDHVREVFEFHCLLNERVRADEDRDLAIRDPLQKLRAGNVGRFRRIDL